MKSLSTSAGERRKDLCAWSLSMDVSYGGKMGEGKNTRGRRLLNLEVTAWLVVLLPTKIDEALSPGKRPQLLGTFPGARLLTKILASNVRRSSQGTSQIEPNLRVCPFPIRSSFLISYTFITQRANLHHSRLRILHIVHVWSVLLRQKFPSENGRANGLKAAWLPSLISDAQQRPFR